MEPAENPLSAVRSALPRETNMAVRRSLELQRLHLAVTVSYHKINTVALPPTPPSYRFVVASQPRPRTFALSCRRTPTRLIRGSPRHGEAESKIALANDNRIEIRRSLPITPGLSRDRPREDARSSKCRVRNVRRCWPVRSELRPSLSVSISGRFPRERSHDYDDVTVRARPGK